jgi:hypothetical protein
VEWVEWSGVDFFFCGIFFFFCSEPSIAFVDRVGSGLVLVSGRLLIGWLVDWLGSLHGVGGVSFLGFRSLRFVFFFFFFFTVNDWNAVGKSYG